jgi:hypothetical protein
VCFASLDAALSVYGALLNSQTFARHALPAVRLVGALLRALEHNIDAVTRVYVALGSTLAHQCDVLRRTAAYAQPQHGSGTGGDLVAAARAYASASDVVGAEIVDETCALLAGVVIAARSASRTAGAGEREWQHQLVVSRITRDQLLRVLVEQPDLCRVVADVCMVSVDERRCLTG